MYPTLAMPSTLAPQRLAPRRSAPPRLAPPRLAPPRLAPRRSAPPRLAPCLTAISTATRQDSASTPNRTAPGKRVLISILLPPPSPPRRAAAPAPPPVGGPPPERPRPADQRDGAPAGQTAEPEEEPGVGGGHVHTSPLIQKIGSAPPTTHGCATAGIGRTISGKSWQPMRTRSAHAPPFGPRASWRMISGSGVIAWSGGACRAS